MLSSFSIRVCNNYFEYVLEVEILIYFQADLTYNIDIIFQQNPFILIYNLKIKYQFSNIFNLFQINASKLRHLFACIDIQAMRLYPKKNQIKVIHDTLVNQYSVDFIFESKDLKIVLKPIQFRIPRKRFFLKIKRPKTEYTSAQEQIKKRSRRCFKRVQKMNDQYNIQFEKMERKLWTKEEDKVLKELLQVKKVSKWSQIARMMASQYGLLGRNGKQCRERYNNHLDSEIKKEEWSQQEQKRLFQLQDEFGNRWSTISKSFEGRQPQNQQFRTDNAIKNYFYSTLRKGIQNINQLITTHFHKQFKILKASIIYKIVEASQKRFNQSDPKTQQTAFACQSIKRGIYQFSKISGSLQQSKIEQLRKLVTQTNQFAKTYRKKKQNKPEKLQQCSDMQQLQDQQYQHVNRNILDFQLNHQNIKSVTTRSTLSKNDHLHETGPSKSNNTFYDGQYNYSSFFISTDCHGNSHSAKDIKNQQYEQTAYTQKFVSLGQHYQNKSKPLRKLFSIGYGPKQQFSSILIEQSYQIQEQSNLPKNENKQEYQSQKSEKKELIFFDDILNKDESFESVD